MRNILFGLGMGLLIGVVGWVWYMQSDRSHVKTSTIVKEISALNRLETAHMVTESIVENDSNTGDMVRDLLFGDKLILVAHAEVIAGIDFSELSKDAVSIKNSDYYLLLPPAKILATTIDNTKTRVYDRRTGLLTKGDMQLESRAREKAEQSLRSLACESSILSIANENASKQIRALFSSFGITKLHIQTQEAPCE